MDKIREYVQAQRPKTIIALIHHTRVAAKIGWKNQGPPSKEGKPNANYPTLPMPCSAKFKSKGTHVTYKGQKKALNGRDGGEVQEGGEVLSMWQDRAQIQNVSDKESTKGNP